MDAAIAILEGLHGPEAPPAPARGVPKPAAVAIVVLMLLAGWKAAQA